MKVVINACYGGFSISEECARWMAAHGSVRAQKDIADYEREVAACQHYMQTGKVPEGTSDFSTRMFDIAIRYHEGKPNYHGYGYVDGMDGGYERNDPILIAAIEALGSEKAGGKHAALRIVEIPDEVDYEIAEYDGYEHIAEKHQTWS